MASNRNLYLAATIACLTGALFGYSVGFIGGVLVLPSFLNHFRLSDLPAQEVASAQSRIVSSWLIGCVIGVPLSVPVCSKYGRKVCIAGCAALYVLGAILQAIEVESDAALALFQVGRLINGVAVGAGTLVSPVYISEISPPSERGMLMSGYQTAIQIFALIGFWGAFVCHSTIQDSSNLQWQLPVLVQLVPGLGLLLGSLAVLPESPRWLIGKDKVGSARKALSWLRMSVEDSAEVRAELLQIERVISANNSTPTPESKRSFFHQSITPPLRKRMLVGSLIMVFQNLVGLNALNYFSPIIFMSAGFTSVSASLFLTGVFGVVKLVTAILFMFVFVRIRGNRFWLLLGSAIMGVAMFLLALCIAEMPAASSSQPSSLNVLGVVSVLMVYIFAFAFGVSLGPISWNVCAEIFPSHVNTKACAVTTSIQWLSQILIASITPPLIARIGYGTYIFYGVCCVLAFGFCAIFVPETRGVALGPDMDRVFGDSPKEDAAVTVDENEDVSETTPLMAKRRRRSSVALVV